MRTYLLAALGVLSAAMLILVALSATVGTQAGDIIQGDADCNGAISAADAVAVLRAAADAPTTGCVESAGNVNCDLEIDEADILAILRHVGGIGGSSAAGTGCTPIGEPLSLPTSTPGTSPTASSPTPTPTATPTITPTSTFTPSPTATVTPTSTPTLSPTPTATPEPNVCESAGAGVAGAPSNTPIEDGYTLDEVISEAALGEAAARKIEFAMIPGAPGQAIIALQTGEICRVSLTGAFPPAPWGDVSDLIVFDNNEQGLLSVAFSPNFLQNGEVFIYYTPPDPRPAAPWFTVLARFDATAIDLDEASRQTVIQIEEHHQNHQGGRIDFDQNGYLLLSLGDGGFSGDPFEASQELDRLLGKVIRLDVSQEPYAIPPSNPFVGVPGAREEIFALGFRNPWRMSVDSLTGEVWLGDVGEAKQEEVDHVIAGGNYGWDCYEGTLPWEATSTPQPQNDQCTGKTFQTPRAVYPHTMGVAIVGGYVYRGSEMPELYGWYVYADFASGGIWAVNTADDSDPILLHDASFFISSFAELPNGELLVVSYNDGIYQLIRN